MCVVSMVLTHKTYEWDNRYWPNNSLQPPLVILTAPPLPFAPLPTDEEIQEFRRLLERARAHDAWDRVWVCWPHGTEPKPESTLVIEPGHKSYSVWATDRINDIPTLGEIPEDDCTIPD